MKIRVTIDLDAHFDALDDLGSRDNGVFGVDKDGVYHMYYHNRSDLCEFKDVVIIEK